MTKKTCEACENTFEDFGHDHLKVCMNCNKPEAEEAREKRLSKLKNFPVTTSFQFSNREIDIELGIVTAQCVFGMNVFRDIFASVRDITGGRSEASEKVLRDLRDTCLAELNEEAHALGADGIISVSLNYQEISGKDKGMLFLVASGTAVKFKEETE